jgi:diguanylate cyclase (GGDEF)-like protein
VAGESRSIKRSDGGSAAGRIALEVSAQHAALLGALEEEIGDVEAGRMAAIAARLAHEFGSVTAAAVDAVVAAEPAPAGGEEAQEQPAGLKPVPDLDAEEQELRSLHRPGHMRRRLEQLIETNRRYDHPFAIAVFDASGPGTRPDDAGGGRETVMAIVGAALRDSIRVVDEVFRLEEDAICVLAPNLRTVEGVQMAERLLSLLDELERAGGLRISISAGVVACPEHGKDAGVLLKKADAALWRARAVGQPVGVGALDPVQDR